MEESKSDEEDSESEKNYSDCNPYLHSDEDSQSGDPELLPLNTLPTQTHTVTFKCIGSVHDVTRQEILSDVSQDLRQRHIVEVRVYSEQENPYDSKAIAFQCYWKGKWQTIGYIVRECLDHVHDALQQKRL